jgi:hypothetical protein
MIPDLPLPPAPGAAGQVRPPGGQSPPIRLGGRPRTAPDPRPPPAGQERPGTPRGPPPLPNPDFEAGAWMPRVLGASGRAASVRAMIMDARVWIPSRSFGAAGNCRGHRPTSGSQCPRPLYKCYNKRQHHFQVDTRCGLKKTRSKLPLSAAKHARVFFLTASFAPRHSSVAVPSRLAGHVVRA